MKFRFSSLVAVVLLTVSPGLVYADWASGLFAETKHDFGTVARAAKTEHRFEFTNDTEGEIHISHVRTSCGCTTPILPEKVIAPGEKGAVIARFNTRSFLGQRGATLTVVFTRPSYREVQLRVDGYVRRDIVCSPGEIDFGKVTLGQPSTHKVNIQYAGRSDWAIEEITCDNPVLSFELTETRRNGGRVGYELITTYAGTEGSGYWQDEVILRTNDSRRPTIPLVVSGQSIQKLQISPATVILGEMALGSATDKRVVLRADEEFSITLIECDDLRITVDPPQDSKKIHVLTFHFECDGNTGEFATPVKIHTDLADADMMSVDFKGTVVAQSRE